ncbi:MAG: hypothetical protein QM655_08455 [Nocardioidaceae bacterium]
MTQALRVIAEALRSSIAQPVVSLITIVMVAGTVVSVVLTAGRSASNQRDVLALLDDETTRTIVVSADQSLDPTLPERVSALHSVECVLALSPAVDVTNARIEGGSRVPMRRAFLPSPGCLGSAFPRASPGVAVGSVMAASQLGLAQGVGGIRTTDGRTYPVVGTVNLPPFLREWDPLVIIPVPDAELVESHALVVLVTDASQVRVTANLVKAMVEQPGVQHVEVRTSEDLAQIHAQVGRRLSRASVGLIAAILATTTLLSALVLTSMVLLRRKDFGRRRALGASRSLVASLVLTQASWLAMTGVAAGLLVSSGILWATNAPWPGVRFALAAGFLAFLAAVIASALPAAVASLREPIRELRVP